MDICPSCSIMDLLNCRFELWPSLPLISDMAPEPGRRPAFSSEFRGLLGSLANVLFRARVCSSVREMFANNVCVVSSGRHGWVYWT